MAEVIKVGRADIAHRNDPNAHAGQIGSHTQLNDLDADGHPQYALADGSRGAFAQPGHEHDGEYADIAHVHEGGGGGGADDQTAAEVPFVPAGDIASDNVQSAIEELDDDKAAATHATQHASGGADPVTPAAIGAAADVHEHDAAYAASAHGHTESEISDLGAYPDATGQPATKVAQTDGANGWTFIDTPSGGGGGADDQTAAEVPFTPAGNLQSTNVQTALQELDGEKSSAGHNHDPDYADISHVHPGAPSGERQERKIYGPSAEAYNERNSLLDDAVGFVTVAATDKGINSTIRGGADGPTVYVTSLADDSSEGTLRYYVEKIGMSSPRDPLWIRFKVSGTIKLQSALYLRPNTTIDGRGASVVIQGSAADTAIIVSAIENPSAAPDLWFTEDAQYQGEWVAAGGSGTAGAYVAGDLVTHVTKQEEQTPGPPPTYKYKWGRAWRANTETTDEPYDAATLAHSPDWDEALDEYEMNVVVTDITTESLSENDNDTVTLDSGFDLVWFNHVDFGSAYDANCDIHRPGGLARVSFNYCRYAPIPDWKRFQLGVAAGNLAGNNTPTDGKQMLCGLDPQDGMNPDALRFNQFRSWHFGNVVRGPKLQRGRNVLSQCLFDRWGELPETNVERVDVDLEAAIAGRSVEIGKDGELLLEDSVFTPYKAGEGHVVTGSLMDLARDVATELPYIIVKGAEPEPLVKARGNYAPAGYTIEQNRPAEVFTGSSYADPEYPHGPVAQRTDAGPDWSGEPPYSTPDFGDIGTTGEILEQHIRELAGNRYLVPEPAVEAGAHGHTESEISDLGAYPDATGQPATKVAQTDGANGWTFIDTPAGGGGGGASGVRTNITANQTLAQNTDNAIAWDGTDTEDEAGMWDAANPSRLVATADGWHAITASFPLSDNMTDGKWVRMRIVVDGALYPVQSQVASRSGLPVSAPVATEVYLTTGQYVELHVRHNDTAGLEFNRFGAGMSMVRR